MNAVWCVKGMKHFGQHVATILSWPLFIDVPIGDDVDVVYIIGMYDPPHYGHTLECTKKAKTRIIHWCGTDVEYLRRAEMLPKAIHLCETKSLQSELHEKGVDAEVCMFPTIQNYPITPLPEKQQVSVYLGSDPDKYGAGMLMAVMDALPEVRFATYLHGHNGPEEMATICKETSVYLRLTRHDGSAMSAREFMAAGRPAVITADLPFVLRVRHDDMIQIVSMLVKALKMEPDQEMIKYYEWDNSEARYLADLFNKAGVTHG